MTIFAQGRSLLWVHGADRIEHPGGTLYEHLNRVQNQLQEWVRPGGVGTASVRDGELVVSALMVVNAFGDLLDPARPSLTGAHWPTVTPGQAGQAMQHTTIGVVATNATLDKVSCLLVSQSAHDGLARALEPAHTLVDGEAIVAASVGGVRAPLEQVRAMAARAVIAAIESALAPQETPHTPPARSSTTDAP
jgi:L-aminopeptidase/D-esterase-like protein